MFNRALISAFCALPAALALLPNAAQAAQGDCVRDICVIFEVSVKLDSELESPNVFARNHTIDINGNPQTYTTVITRAEDTCTKQVKVPRAVYTSVTEVLGSIGSGAPVLTPTQQTILLFYTTLMQQTLGFTCTPRELDKEKSGTGTGTGNPTDPIPQIGTQITGMMDMGNGQPILLVVENGRSRSVGVGAVLLGGWKVIRIEENGATLQKNGRDVIVPIGGTVTI